MNATLTLSTCEEHMDSELSNYYIIQYYWVSSLKYNIFVHCLREVGMQKCLSASIISYIGVASPPTLGYIMASLN